MLEPTRNHKQRYGDIPDNGIYCFMEDKDGIIWMGGKEKGLFRLEKDETHFSIQQFTNQPENKCSLSNNSVYSICQDSHNRIWIGCFGGGINLLTKSTDGKIRFIHSNNELKTSDQPFHESQMHYRSIRGGDHCRHNRRTVDILQQLWTTGRNQIPSKYTQPEYSIQSGQQWCHQHLYRQPKNDISTFTGGVSRYSPESSQ